MTTLHRASQCRPTCTCAAGCGAHWGSRCGHPHVADTSCMMEATVHCYLLLFCKSSLLAAVVEDFPSIQQ
jgi:hypothetical protein